MATNYLIAGFGANEKIFKHVTEVIPNCQYLPFPIPNAKDTMASYAEKFIPLIDYTHPFNIIGNSMGGIITMEIIKHITPEKTILISSVKNRKEMPFKLKYLKYTHLHKIVSGGLVQHSIKFGSKFKKEIDKELRLTVIEMAYSNSPKFLYWAMNAIIKWNGNSIRNDIFHIHGTKDELFPFRRIQHAIPIEGGSHAMMLTTPEKVIPALKEVLL